MIDKQIELQDHELALCRLIGNMRSIVARSASVKNVQMGKQSPLEIDENGVIGEYAFCKMWNIFFDCSVNPRSGSFDCVLMGKAFDIKTTTYKSGRLTATLKRNSDVDCYALAILDKNTVIFPGWVYADDFCTEENISDLGHGRGYVMDQSKLRAWK